MKISPRNRALAFLLALGFSSFSAAETPNDGQVAYNRGDYPTALRIWGDLADQGVATAQVRLGLMHARGHGTPRDDVEAVKWYRKAAEQGFAMAQDNLGVTYRDGRGVTQDPGIAVDWFRKASAN